MNRKLFSPSARKRAVSIVKKMTRSLNRTIGRHWTNAKDSTSIVLTSFYTQYKYTSAPVSKNIVVSQNIAKLTSRNIANQQCTRIATFSRLHRFATPPNHGQPPPSPWPPVTKTPHQPLSISSPEYQTLPHPSPLCGRPSTLHRMASNSANSARRLISRTTRMQTKCSPTPCQAPFDRGLQHHWRWLPRSLGIPYLDRALHHCLPCAVKSTLLDSPPQNCLFSALRIALLAAAPGSARLPDRHLETWNLHILKG